MTKAEFYALCERHGIPPELWPGLWGLAGAESTWSTCGGDYPTRDEVRDMIANPNEHDIWPGAGE